MAEETRQSPLDALCLDVLKSICKAMRQINLYSGSHPAVQALIVQTMSQLKDLLSLADEGKVFYALDGDQLVANGRIIGQVHQVPSSVQQLFTRFKLNSLGFTGGVSESELMSLCELGSLRPEQAKDVVASERLSAAGVEHIQLNEAVYTKVDEAQEKTPVERTVEVKEVLDNIDERPLEDTVQKLIWANVTDPHDRAKIIESVMARVRKDIQDAVKEATQELVKQKTTLENEQARTQAVLGSMADGVVTVSDSGEVLMMNPEAEEMLGDKMKDTVGKSLPKFIKDEHLLSMSKEIKAPEDREIDSEVDIVATEDAKRTLRKSTVVVRNEKGKPVGMVSGLSDKAKHREVDKMEREFIAHVTHELRSPLTSIRAALEIMQDAVVSKLADDDKQMMTSALRNADRLEQLINGILDFSKIESGEMTVIPKGIDAEGIAAEAVESMQPWTKKKGVNLHLEVSPGLPPVLADKSRTVQVVVNLLSNAIKFTPKGGHITIRIEPGAGKHAKFVQYSVKDTGPGIPKKEQPKVFEKVVQIAAGERHVGGTGLGLAIAKALVHLQNGTLWLESDAGKGAKFLFTLPHYVAPRDEAAAKPKPKPKPRSWWKRILGIGS